MLILMGLVLVLLVVTEGYRAARLTEFWNPSSTDPVGPDQQLIQGKYALGSGGLFGVGLGASREKWGWLPESTSDMIFAIIGEELGLVGTLCVTTLYGALAWAGLRVTRRVPDTFSRLLAAAVTAWIMVQAVVNIGGVIGVFPITGVPLPLVSQGLSSVLTTMVGLGMLMSLARREPGASQALAARGRSPVGRALSLLRPGKRRAAGRARVSGPW
jgi:cell division protein FtsW